MNYLDSPTYYVLAGNYDQFVCWCRENHLSPQDPSVKYIRDEHYLCGIPIFEDDVLIKYGSYFEKYKNLDIIEFEFSLRQKRFKIPVKKDSSVYFGKRIKATHIKGSIEGFVIDIFKAKIIPDRSKVLKYYKTTSPEQFMKTMIIDRLILQTEESYAIIPITSRIKITALEEQKKFIRRINLDFVFNTQQISYQTCRKIMNQSGHLM